MIIRKKNYEIVLIYNFSSDHVVINLCPGQPYCNLQYGTKSTLLGGAVIGSVRGLSATYYNPGAVALFNDPKLILSAKVYQYEAITVVNGAGENKDLDYSSISPEPTFVAFDIIIDTTGRNKYQTSWAVGFGATYWGKSLSVHLGVEWYNVVKKYGPITLNPLIKFAISKFVTIK